MVVDAANKRRGPITGAVGQRGLDRRHRADRIEQAQRVIERDRDGPEDFRQAALRNTAQHFHLRETQMRMHETERNSEIAVALGRDERHEMLVPADLDRRGKRRTRARQRREALCDRLPAWPVSQPRPGQAEREARKASNRC